MTATPQDQIRTDPSASLSPHRSLNRTAGITLMIISVLMIALMMHHPTAGGHNMQEFVSGIQEIQTINLLVHSGALLIMILLGFCLSALSSNLETHKPYVRLASVFYAAGLLNMFAAATVSGFLVPGFANTLVDASAADLATAGQIFHLLREINHTCDEFGVMGMSAGIFWWSMQMCVLPKARQVGIVGLVAGLTGIAGLFSGHTGASLHGVLLFVLLQGIWNVLVGIGLIRDWWSHNSRDSR